MNPTAAHMRAFELILEQQDRFTSYVAHKREATPTGAYPPGMYTMAEAFLSKDFEMMILNKVGALLAPESTEDLNLTVRI